MVRLEQRTLTELVQKSAEKFGKRTAFSLFSEGTLTNITSYEEFGKRSLGIASILEQLGLQKGDRVMLLAENR
ncbi:MAG: AMP-binding protein, partial [Treponema sp.]|nr:AMP-binding protein [Treponema sp.]